MRPPKDKNSGKHPQDPDYDDSYNYQEEYDRWLDEQEMKYEHEKENN